MVKKLFEIGDEVFYIGYSFWGRKKVYSFVIEWYIVINHDTLGEIAIMYGHGTTNNVFKWNDIFDTKEKALDSLKKKL